MLKLKHTVAALVASVVVLPLGMVPMTMEACGDNSKSFATACTQGLANRCRHPPIGLVNQLLNSEGMPDLMPRMLLSLSRLVMHPVWLEIALLLMYLCHHVNSNRTTGDRRRSRCRRWHSEFATAKWRPESDIDCEASRSRSALRTDKVCMYSEVLHVMM